MTDGPKTGPEDTGNGGANPSGKSPKRRRWLLIGSLTLNLFFIAWMVTAGLMHWHGHRHWRDADGGHWGRSGGPFSGMRHLLHADLDDRPEMAALRTRHADQLTTALERAKAARAAARDIMRDRDRDPKALDAAFADVRESTRAFQEAMHATIVDAAGTLPPDEFRSLMRPKRWKRD